MSHQRPGDTIPLQQETEAVIDKRLNTPLVLGFDLTIHGNTPDGLIPSVAAPLYIAKGLPPEEQLVNRFGYWCATWPIVVPAGHHFGPTYIPIGHSPTNVAWDDEIAAAKPVWEVAEFHVISPSNNSHLVVAMTDTSEENASIAYSITNYNFGFLDWANPVYHVGTDFVVPTEFPWQVISTAGGVYILNLMLRAAFLA